MASDYKLISSDSHILEPPDLWTDRVPAKYRDRAPRMTRLEQGDAWILDGVPDPIGFGMNAVAGKQPEDVGPFIRYEDTPPGGHDPAARLEEQDLDGVAAEILYPSPRLCTMMCSASNEPEFHLGLVQAYNNWLSDFCGHAPDRLVGNPLLPNIGAEAAVKELYRTAELPGLTSFHIGQYPHGGLDISEEDDPLWAAAQEMGVPVNIHVGLTQGQPGVVHQKGHKIAGILRWNDAPTRIMDFIFTGALDRFPSLKVVLSEVDCGWVPYFKEQLDLQFKRKRLFHGLTNTEPPSWYMDRHFYFTFIIDRYGVQLRHAIGVDKMMWSNDYPHLLLEFPHSWDSVNERFGDVPEDEKYAILAGNAKKMYGC